MVSHQPPRFIRNLLAQFPGGGENQHLHNRQAVIDAFDGGQHKCRGFSRAGASLADAIDAFKSDRNKSGLNGARSVIFDAFESRQRPWTQSEIGKAGLIPFCHVLQCFSSTCLRTTNKPLCQPIDLNLTKIPRDRNRVN